jgi:hypothetical protein
MKWKIDPFVGVEELKFGMSPIEVESVFLKSNHQIDRSNEYINYYYPGRGQPVLGFQNMKLVDVTFGRWTEALFFDGLDYFQTPPSVFLGRVRSHDPDVKRNPLGQITSFALGIAFDNVALGESDKTIMAFARSEIETYKEFGPFTPA